MNYFLKNTSNFKYNKTEYNKAIVIYHDMYENILPKINNVEYLSFNEFKIKYSALDYDMIFIVGLNRIITPSNRCDFINEYLQTMTPNIKKISIDSSPFIGEPWRLWFHYSITNTGNFNITYSYVIETEWKKWFLYESNDCRLSHNNILNFIDNTHSDLDLLNTKFNFFNVSDVENETYQKQLNLIIDKYNSPKLIINNLLKLVDNNFLTKINFNSYLDNNIINVPNLGIYRFLVKENIRRMNIYNKVIKYENL